MIEPQDRTRDGSAKGRPASEPIDLRGLKCPLPALKVEKALARALPGSRLEVLADDPLARLDLAHLCRQGGHRLDAVEPLEAGGWRFRIRRARTGNG